MTGTPYRDIGNPTNLFASDPSGNPIPVNADATGNLTIAAAGASLASPQAANVSQIAGANITLAGGGGPALPGVDGSARITVAPGGNLTLNGTTTWNTITLISGNTTPGNTTMNRSGGGNLTLLSGTLTEASPRTLPGPGPNSNISISWQLNLGLGTAAIVVASGGNATSA